MDRLVACVREDQLGPKLPGLQEYWAEPTRAWRAKLESAVSEEGFRGEFVAGLPASLRDRVSPDLWRLSWPLMNTPVRHEIAVRLMEGLKETSPGSLRTSPTCASIGSDSHRVGPA